MKQIKEYIEIVHVIPPLDHWKGFGKHNELIAERIEKLHKEKRNNYVLGSLKENLPPVPKDTLIKVGGGDWDICIPERIRILRKLGYTNIQADKSISFSVCDDVAINWGKK